MSLPLSLSQSGVMIAADGRPFQADAAGIIYYLTPAQAAEAVSAIQSANHYLDPRLVAYAHGTVQATLTSAQSLALLQTENPGLTQADLQYIRDPTIPAGFDAAKQLPYYTSYLGNRVYVNDGSIPEPTNSFVHSYTWDSLNGGWSSSLNSGGLLGLIEGAAALAGPTIIGPLLTGSPTIFSAGASAASSSAVSTSTLASGPVAASSALAASGAAGSAGSIALSALGASTAALRALAAGPGQASANLAAGTTPNNVLPQGSNLGLLALLGLVAAVVVSKG